MSSNYHVQRSDEEVDDLLNEAGENVDEAASAYPGKRFEEGVAHGLSWALGLTEEHPLRPEPE